MLAGMDDRLHEAGHRVMAHLLGLTIPKAAISYTLAPGAMCFEAVQEPLLSEHAQGNPIVVEKHALVALAGDAAQWSYLPDARVITANRSLIIKTSLTG